MRLTLLEAMLLKLLVQRRGAGRDEGRDPGEGLEPERRHRDARRRQLRDAPAALPRATTRAVHACCRRCAASATGWLERGVRYPPLTGGMKTSSSPSREHRGRTARSAGSPPQPGSARLGARAGCCVDEVLPGVLGRGPAARARARPRHGRPLSRSGGEEPHAHAHEARFHMNAAGGQASRPCDRPAAAPCHRPARAGGPARPLHSRGRVPCRATGSGARSTTCGSR